MNLISKLQAILKVLAGPTQESVTPQQKEIAESAFILEAKTKAKEIIIEAKEQELKIKAQAEEEARRIKEASIEGEKRLVVEKAQIEADRRDIENKVKTLRGAKEAIEKKQIELDEMFEKTKGQLEHVASLTKEEAKKMLLDNIDKDLVQEKGKKIRQVEEDIRSRAEYLYKEILLDAMKFGATDYVVEHTTSKLKLTEEDMKGRIIGKEGRNIRTFEELTGVDLDMDSSPGDVIVSCFDPVRREIGKISLERLMADGRIQPARIEEIVEKTKKELEHIMYKEGDNLCHKVGAYNLPRDIIQILGRFKYRFSYGQNMVEHTLEVTRIGMAIASELGINLEIVKLGCLLHDIGKVMTDQEGSHVDLSVDVLRKYKIDEKIITAVAEHHNDNQSSIESAVVALADHISGARPGSRSEDYEAYATRMKALEEASTSFDGVEKAYAVSAGREVRVFVKPEVVDDDSTALLAREIARKIELEQSYPGTVKIIVIRETRVSDTAK